jgi:hypothetical protein
MLSASALADDLAKYLGLGAGVDEERALVAADLTLQRIELVVSPVPDAARPIALEVAVRGYQNPHGTTSEQTGPFQRSFRFPGVYLTKRERADLRRLVGAGGAFTINPIAPPA